MTTSVTGRRFRHVLCPVDFSEYSRTALRYAAALARRSKGRLTVLYVNDPLLGAAAAAAYDVKALVAKADAELRRFVARAIGANAPTTTTLTVYGRPAPEIRKVAKRLGVDLAVMGSRGLTGPGKWFFGSTTERMLRTTSVPLLVVPKPKHRLRARWGKGMRLWPGRTILVPVDLGDYALADIRAAMSMVRAFHANTLLVYAIAPAQLPPWLRLDSRAYDLDRVETARTALERLALAVRGHADCQIVVGDPAQQIAACAANTRAGLIILTLKRASTPLGPRQGSITYQVLLSEAAPILAIPESRRR